MKTKYRELIEIKLSARKILLKLLIYDYLPIFLYIGYFLLFVHHDSYQVYFIATAVITVSFTIAFHYDALLILLPLSLKGLSWKFTVKEDILTCYDPSKEKYFSIKLSDISYVYQKKDLFGFIREYKLIIETSQKRVVIEMATASTLNIVLIFLEDIGLKSSFKYRVEKRNFIDKNLKNQGTFYFRKLLLPSTLFKFFLFSIITLGAIFYLSNPLNESFIFALFLFIPFYHMFKEMKVLLTMHKEDKWEIIIVNGRIIWNSPIDIKESFSLNLEEVEKVIWKETIDEGIVVSEQYTIKLKSGEEILLDDELNFSLSSLAPLVGRVYKQEY